MIKQQDEDREIKKKRKREKRAAEKHVIKRVLRCADFDEDFELETFEKFGR